MAVKTMEKSSFLKYFEILKSKFFKIILLNAIFFTVLSILLVLIMAISAGVSSIFGEISDLWTILTFIPLVLLGPVVAAITKLMRDFVREEPGFFLDDLKKAFKENFKQSIIISLIQYVITWVVLIAARFYYSLIDNGAFYVIGLGVTIFVALAVLVSGYYVYMMTVTLKLKIREIIKNSLIFTMLCFARNIVLTFVLAIWLLVNAAFVYFAIISGNSFVYGLVISLFMVLTFGIIFYTVAFFTFPPIKTYILDPYYESHPEESSASVLDKPNAEDIDYSAQNEEKELPEFVYHNGRMVHRSTLEQESIFSDESVFPNKEDN